MSRQDGDRDKDVPAYVPGMPKTFCEGCRKTFPESKLKVCSGCKLKRYCSRECQRDNWKIHKKICEFAGKSLGTKSYDKETKSERKQRRQTTQELSKEVERVFHERHVALYLLAEIGGLTLASSVIMIDMRQNPPAAWPISVEDAIREVVEMNMAANKATAEAQIEVIRRNAATNGTSLTAYAFHPEPDQLGPYNDDSPFRLLQKTFMCDPLLGSYANMPPGLQMMSRAFNELEDSEQEQAIARLQTGEF